VRQLGVVGLFFLFLLVGPVRAQPLEVKADANVTFYWKYYDAQGGSWTEFGQGNRALLQRDPAAANVSIRCVGWLNLLQDLVGDASRVPQVSPSISIKTEPRLNPVRASVCIGAVIGAVAAGLHWLRSRRQKVALQEVTQTYIQALDAQNVATLFRTDGTHPDRIGTYKVRSHLGTGGMAMVYQVVSPDGHSCALKLPLPQFGNDPEYRDRFSREMRLGSSVSHPNVARIFDVHLPTSPAEYPYYVMEYVNGTSWEELLKMGKLNDKNVFKWTRGVLQGLEMVHSKGIIHRDIKPANIVIAAGGMAKLMDFGIAKDLQARTMLTKPDEAVGTPAFMAPEQLTAGPIGPPTDLYAVGLLVYNSLTGKLPWKEDDLQSILVYKLSGEPLPPMDRLDLPSEVTDWVMKMLEPDPANRYQTAAEARVALERATEKLP
jgi:serine/threonine protein kinase